MSILRKSAKGRECTVRVPGVCKNITDTTVLAHLNGGGMGMKHHDIFGAYACHECHSILDGRLGVDTEYTRDDLLFYHYQGMVRTQQIMLNEGLIQVKGDKTKKSIEWYKNNLT